MKKLKENVHTIQVGCQNCGRAHLDKTRPLKEEVKSIEEAKYGEFRKPLPFNNGAKYHVGPPGYYTRIDNRLPVKEKRPSLEELMNKRLEESTRRRTEMEEWITKEFHTKVANKINSPSLDQCKVVYANEKTSLDNGRHKISIASNKCTQIVQTNDVYPKILPCQLPPKELNTENFTLPCTIGSLNFYAMAALGTNVNVIPKSIFKYLKLARLKKTEMLVEMADMTKRSCWELKTSEVTIEELTDLDSLKKLGWRWTKKEEPLGKRRSGSIFKEMEFGVSLTRVRVVERFCIGVTTMVTP
ncbi:hypothetical protein Tco_0046814 [Tanacetum coccineum]